MGDEIETYSTKGAVCPYCGHENYVEGENSSEGEHEDCCAKCEKAFIFTIEYSISFESEKVVPYLRHEIESQKKAIERYKAWNLRSSTPPNQYTWNVEHHQSKLDVLENKLARELKEDQGDH